MTRSASLLTCSALFLFLSGCVVPPLRFGGGGGGAAGTVVTRNSADELRRHGHAASGQVRVAFTPMTLVQSARTRTADLSFGWTLDWTETRFWHDFRHGPFAEGVWFLRQGRGERHQRWRFGPTLLAETRMIQREDLDVYGFGMAGGVLLEFAEYYDGPMVLGTARGELAFGVAARVGVRHYDGGTHAYGILSLELRLPGLAAIPLPPAKQRWNY